MSIEILVSEYQFVSNAEAWQTSGQPLLISTIQAQHFSLFGNSARLDDSADTKKILTALLPED